MQLAREELALRAGKQLEPLLLPVRDALARQHRPGAPFWQLLEFRDHVLRYEDRQALYERAACMFNLP